MHDDLLMNHKAEADSHTQIQHKQIQDIKKMSPNNVTKMIYVWRPVFANMKKTSQTPEISDYPFNLFTNLFIGLSFLERPYLMLRPNLMQFWHVYLS